MKKLCFSVFLLLAFSVVSPSVVSASLVKETSGALLTDDFDRPDNSDINSGLGMPLWATSFTGDGGGIHSIEIKNNKLRIYATGGNRCDPDNPGCHNNGDWPVVTSISHFSNAVLEYDMTIQVMGGGTVAHAEAFYTYFRLTDVDHGYSFGYDHWPYGSQNHILLTKPPRLWKHETPPELGRTNWVHSTPETYSNKILFDGSSIKTWSDNSLIFSITDPSYFLHGSIGFGQYIADGFGGVNQGDAYYDNVRVYLVPANNPVKIKVDAQGLIVEAYTLDNSLIDSEVSDPNGEVLLDLSSVSSFPTSARIIVKENGDVIFEEVITADGVDGVYPRDVWRLLTYTASYTPAPPTIDGVIDPVEWQNANRYDLTFINLGDLGNRIVPVYFENDGIYLYCAATVPFPTHPEAYFGVYIDGDHSHTFNGSMSEPHVDIGYNKAGSTAPRYWFYDTYWAEVPPCGVVQQDAVTSPPGSEHAFSGSSELSYEFKIPLSDLTAQSGENVGVEMLFGTDGTSSGGYLFPSTDYCDIANWPDLEIEAGQPQATGGIGGYVEDNQGQPIANALVKAIQNGSVIGSAYSDLQGEFLITGLPEGMYEVMASAEGFEQSPPWDAQVQAGVITLGVHLALMPLPADVVWTITNTVVDMNEDFHVDVRATNPATNPQSVTLKVLLTQWDPQPDPASHGWDWKWQRIGGWQEYVFGQEITWPIPASSEDHSWFIGRHYWEWIPPWNLSIFLSNILVDAMADYCLNLQGVGGILELLEAALIRVNAIDEVRYWYMGYHDASEIPFQVTVKVPDRKQQLFVKSVVLAVESNALPLLAAKSNLPIYVVVPVSISSIPLLALSKWAYTMAYDPPDSNFDVIVTPENIPLPELETLEPSVAKDVAGLSFVLLALAKAAGSSYEKYQGAVLADSAQWITVQAAATEYYLGQAALVSDSICTLLGDIFLGATPPTPEEIAQIRDSLLQNGPTNTEISVLSRLGFSGAEIEDLNDVRVSLGDIFYTSFDIPMSCMEAVSNILGNLADSLVGLPEGRLVADIDFSPDTIILEAPPSHLRCYIELPEGFDVENIDVSSIEMSYSILAQPSPIKIGDYDGDGVPDLMVQFLLDQMLPALEPGELALAVTGNVHDGDIILFGSIDLLTIMEHPPVGSISGTVSDYLGGLLGVTVDIYDSVGAVWQSVVTDDSGYYHVDSIPNGQYTATVVTPIGYQADQETKQFTINHTPVTVDFSLAKLNITPRPRSRAYWAHQLHKAFQNKPRDYTVSDFSRFAALINTHFNQNPINPVDFYAVSQPASQQDSLMALKKLLHMCQGEEEPFLKRFAKAQLMALMLNVVSGKISQTEEISADGRTVSQVITYCDMLVNDEIDCPDNVPGHGSPLCRYILTDFILTFTNLGLPVPQGLIPEDVVEIAYRIHNQDNLPEGFALSQNYPNPFNPICEIEYALPTDCQVTLTIYNVLGQKVRVLVDEYQSAGSKSVKWDSKDDQRREVTSGIYFYRITAGDFNETKKMVLLR